MKNINKKIKILYYLETYSIGGIEKVVDTFYSYFKNDYDVNILCGENLTNKKVEHLLNKKYYHYIRTYLCFKYFDKFLKHNKYDIIHINLYNGIQLKYAYIASKYCNNVIVHAHNSNFSYDMFGLKKLINKLYIKKYSGNYKYLSVSDCSSIFCFNKKSIIIPSSFNYTDFKYDERFRTKLRNKFKIPSDSIVLGNIGRLNRQKNVMFLVDVFIKYNKMNPNSYLVLIGDGNLKRKILEKNINNLILLNSTDNVSKYYNMFDLFLVPSNFEGFGRTIIESQINGLYTIISNNIDSQVIISSNVVKLDLILDDWVKNIKKIKRNDKVDYKYSNDNVLLKLDDIYKDFH